MVIASQALKWNSVQQALLLEAPPETFERIAVALRKAIATTKPRVQYYALQGLRELGGKYKEEAYGALTDYLSTALMTKSVTWRDGTLTIALDLYGYHRDESIPLLCQVIESFQFIPNLEKDLVSPETPAWVKKADQANLKIFLEILAKKPAETAQEFK